MQAELISLRKEEQIKLLESFRDFIIFFDSLIMSIWGGDLLKKQKKPKIKRESEPNYCDKGGHAERSKANDDRKNGHRAWWKKKEKKEKYKKESE